MKNLLLLPVLVVGFGLITASTDCLHAATFTVTTTNISGPGSLPVIINQANATPGKNVIQFTVTNTITPGCLLPTFTNSVTITGRTNISTVISGGGVLPLFTFAAGTTNNLSNLVLANGYTTNGGAAINNGGTLYISGCVLTNSLAPGGYGGAVSNAGTMTIATTTFLNNSATNGGAVFSTGNMTISLCFFSQNQAANGGAIYNTGNLSLNSLNISNNTATLGFGGAVYNAGSLTINSSTLAFNQASGGSGGSGHYVGGGGGAGLGGAFFIASGVVAMTNTTIVDNFAVGGAGGNALTNYGAADYNANGGGNNGGIRSYSTLYNGGFGGGGAGGDAWTGAGGTGGFGGGGGGISGSNQSYGYNAGFGGGNGGTCNFTGCGGGGGGGIGAGIFVKGGTLLLVNCTICSNSTTGGIGGQFSQGYSGDAGRAIGAGVFNYGGSVYLLNSIVAGNSAASTSPDLYGAFTSPGFNLIGNNQGATNLSINDFQNIAANLGPLQKNGGATLTCAPLPGSYAIGYGTSTGAPTTDQRGVPRPQNGAYDIGAVQVLANSPFVAGGAMVKGSGYILNTIFDVTNSYRIQASSNLSTWIGIYTNGSGGGIQFIDSAATNLTRRFYRTATP